MDGKKHPPLVRSKSAIIMRAREARAQAAKSGKAEANYVTEDDFVDFVNVLAPPSLCLSLCFCLYFSLCLSHLLFRRSMSYVVFP